MSLKTIRAWISSIILTVMGKHFPSRQTEAADTEKWEMNREIKAWISGNTGK
ncbi:MAG: hypothetical protein QM683_05255 [Lacrimispora sp.]